MKYKSLLACMLFSICCSGLWAQKIAYTNLELLLAYLPETKTVQEKLQGSQQRLAQNVQAKESYFNVKYQEYVELAQSGTATEQQLLPLQQELQKLQAEVQQAAANAERQLAQEQAQMMQPILDSLQEKMEALAKERGYDYILNSNASGSSIILYGGGAEDISEELLKRMGVEIPTEGDGK